MNIFPIGNGFNQAKLTASVKQLHPLYFMRGVKTFIYRLNVSMSVHSGEHF